MRMKAVLDLRTATEAKEDHPVDNLFGFFNEPEYFRMQDALRVRVRRLLHAHTFVALSESCSVPDPDTPTHPE